MNWPTCNCGSERIHLTTDNIENKCSCCNQKKGRTNGDGEFGVIVVICGQKYTKHHKK